MRLDDIVEESQTTALSSERSLADTGEMAVGIELQAVKDSHRSDVLHVAILHDSVEDNLPMGIHVLQFVPSDVLQEGRDREDGACGEPA